MNNQPSETQQIQVTTISQVIDTQQPALQNLPIETERRPMNSKIETRGGKKNNTVVGAK